MTQSNEDKISYILKNELMITLAVNKGHKPSEDDQFKEIRKEIRRLRSELGFK
jgi:hypothetical protein